MHVFPSIEKVVFIVCDDFRFEGSGKVSMFGIYGDKLKVEQLTDSKTVNFMSLGVYVAFPDGIGTFHSTICLKGPDGKEFIPEGHKSGEVVKTDDGWMNFAIKLSPFEGTLGEYFVTVNLESEGETQDYTKSFSIIENIAT